eukprot:3275158-Rhodomonas_salina.3
MLHSEQSWITSGVKSTDARAPTRPMLAEQAPFAPSSHAHIPCALLERSRSHDVVHASSIHALLTCVHASSNHGLRAVLTLVAEQIQQSGIAWQAKTALLDVICKKVKEGQRPVSL